MVKNLLHVNIQKILASHVFYIVILIVASFLYFGHLFYPVPKTFTTPDLLLSDQLNLNFSLKRILAESLKGGRLPWWEPRVANGFPLIGESQIGAFYLPNLILFRFIPFEYAFNLGYVVSFALAAVGAYLFFYVHSRHRLVSALTSLAFTYSATMFLQLTHYNLLQTYSLIPLIFYCFERLLSAKRRSFWTALLAFLLSQQFFAGYVMTSFMTGLIALLYCALRLRTLDRKVNVGQLLRSLAALFLPLYILVFVASAIQLFPMIEYAAASTRRGGTGLYALANSFPVEGMLTYVDFNHFGSPTEGTFDASVIRRLRNTLWDANVYVGIVPIAIFFMGFVLQKRKQEMRIYSILITVSLILAMGQYTPFYLVYLLPLFNLFRTPVRFTIMVNFFLLTAVSVIVAQLLHYKRAQRGKSGKGIMRALLIAALILTIVDLARISRLYHPTDTLENIEKSVVARKLHEKAGSMLFENREKAYLIGNEYVWFLTMREENWKSMKKYDFFRNDLNVFLNTVYDIPVVNLFLGSSYYPKSAETAELLLEGAFEDMVADNKRWFHLTDFYIASLEDRDAIFQRRIKPSRLFVELLRQRGARYVVTPFLIDDTDDMARVMEISDDFDIPHFIRVYELTDARSRFYLSTNYKKISTVREYRDGLQDISSGDAPVYGTHDKLADILHHPGANESTITLTSNSKTHVTLSVEAANQSILVSTDAFYPGWRAKIDGKTVPLYDVNVNQRAVVVPSGRHAVEFRLEPWWYYLAILLTFGGHGVMLVMLGFRAPPLFGVQALDIS